MLDVITAHRVVMQNQRLKSVVAPLVIQLNNFFNKNHNNRTINGNLFQQFSNIINIINFVSMAMWEREENGKNFQIGRDRKWMFL